MKSIDLYPLRFDPVFQYRIWGGRRLANLFDGALPGEEPIGEAWLLSDRDDHPSHVADGPFQGRTIAELLRQAPEEMLGRLAGRFARFPLLLKFLDASDTLSVQVHPSDLQAEYLPPGESGKTEAWVVLETEAEGRIYAGLMPRVTKEVMQRALAEGKVEDCLASFAPRPGDAVLIPAGTVHALGGVVAFEVQENSDVTFRLYDWNHLDTKTGQPRHLQIDQAMACIDFAQGALRPVSPVVEEDKPALRERVFFCEHFGLWRLSGEVPFNVGAPQVPRVLVGLSGEGQVEHGGAFYALGKGDVMLLPAVLDVCLFRPTGVTGTVSLLEISLPGDL